MERFYDNNDLIRYIEEKIIGLVPSNSPDEISTIIPDKIWNCMTISVQKDIQELYDVYYSEYWTATCLMAYRVLELVLRVHVQCDLGLENVNNLGHSIKYLKNNNYPESLLNNLEKCRQERNDFMHGEKRAGSSEAKSIVGYVMLIALQIYNIKPK